LPAHGTPRRRFARGIGVKLHATSTASRRLFDQRRYASVLWSASFASIHWKPAGSQSPSWSAGSARYVGVQVADPALDAAMRGVVEEMPVEARVVLPLAPLAELAAHEEELLPGLRPLVAEKEAEVRALLPRVARHLVEQRTLPVHDLVVRERQDEVLENAYRWRNVSSL
jgi:hypothetical protein